MWVLCDVLLSPALYMGLQSLGCWLSDFIGNCLRKRRFGFLHSESKSCGRKLVESSTRASFPSPYINAFAKVISCACCFPGQAVRSCPNQL